MFRASRSCCRSLSSSFELIVRLGGVGSRCSCCCCCCCGRGPDAGLELSKSFKFFLEARYSFLMFCKVSSVSGLFKNSVIFEVFIGRIPLVWIWVSNEGQGIKSTQKEVRCLAFVDFSMSDARAQEASTETKTEGTQVYIDVNLLETREKTAFNQSLLATSACLEHDRNKELL